MPCATEHICLNALLGPAPHSSCSCICPQLAVTPYRLPNIIFCEQQAEVKTIDHLFQVGACVQESASRLRNQRTQLRTHMETLLLTAYGLKWNLAKQLGPGDVYGAIHRACREHLESIEAQSPHPPLKQAASMLRDVLESGYQTA